MTTADGDLSAAGGFGVTLGSVTACVGDILAGVPVLIVVVEATVEVESVVVASRLGSVTLK